MAKTKSKNIEIETDDIQEKAQEKIIIENIAAKEENLAEPNLDAVIEKIVEAVKEQTEKPATEQLKIKNLSPQTLVSVKSNCYGQLIYVSKKTGSQTEWDNFGSYQYLSLEELLTMRNTKRKFFEKNWIVITGFIDTEYENEFSVEEILDYLQIRQYYKDSLCPSNIDEIFNMSPEEIKKRVPNMSSGVKNSIIVRANELIENQTLDSLKVINALEESLNCELSRP